MFSFIVPPLVAGAVVVVPPPVAVVPVVLEVLLPPPPPHADSTSIPAPTTNATAESQMRLLNRFSGVNCASRPFCLPPGLLDLLGHNDVPFRTAVSHASPRFTPRLRPMTFLIEVVDVSAAVAATGARSGKIALLAALLGRLEPDEVPVVVGLLSGAPRQGRIGVGWATLSGAQRQPAASPSL